MKSLAVIICIGLTFGCQNLEKSKDQQILITQNNPNPQLVGSAQSRTSNRINVAILTFDGVQIIDYTGPYEVFGGVGYNTYTISNDTSVITTSHNMKVVPNYTFLDYPKPDIIVVPGGAVAHNLKKEDPRIDWLLKNNEPTTQFLGVCNGVFILASAGMLDNREATTVATMIDHLKHSAPKAIPIYDKRVTDSDNIITCGGFMASIDGALHVIRKNSGVARTQLIANNLEYNWDSEGKYVRYKLPDILIPLYLDVNPPLRREKIESYFGDEDNWTATYIINHESSIKEISEQLNNVAKMYDWQKKDEELTQEQFKANYIIKDELDRVWSFESTIKTTDEINKKFVAIKINKIT